MNFNIIILYFFFNIIIFVFFPYFTANFNINLNYI